MVKILWARGNIMHSLIHNISHKTVFLFPESESGSVVSDCCNPMDCSPLGSAVHGILQARILEWVAISYSRGSSRPKDQTWVSCFAGRFFIFWATSHTDGIRLFQGANSPYSGLKSRRSLGLCDFWMCLNV